MTNVLLNCAGRRRYLANFFRTALAGEGLVVGSDMDASAPALAGCDKVHLVPSVFTPDYLTRLKDVIRKEKIGLVFSLNDLELALLSENRHAIETETGAVLYVPPMSTVAICSDKWQTYRFAQESGLAAPRTFLSADEALRTVATGALDYPLIVKPRWGSGSIALFRVSSETELLSAFERCDTAVRSSILAPLGREEAVIVQEFIAGPEYGVDVLYSKDECFIGFAAKRKLGMRAGETDKAVTVSPVPFAGVIERIASKLPHRGNLDCDILERDGQLYLLEMNPRFGGGYPFTHLAGANHVAMLLNDYRGVPLPAYGYTVGKAFAKFDSLVEVPAEQP